MSILVVHMSLFSRYYDMKKHAAVKEQKTLDASVKVNSHVESYYTLLHVLVTNCLYTRADTACVSKPIMARSCEPISALT